MILPTIHLNGTSHEDLIEQHTLVIEDLNAALRRMQDAGPNARDYYPQGPKAFTQAQAEHQARLQALQAVIVDYAALLDAVAFVADRFGTQMKPEGGQ